MNELNELDELIGKAIDASITFEAIMDSIDFNSYLPADEDTPEYRNYKDSVDKAKKCCDDVITDLPIELVTKIKEIEEQNRDSILLDLKKVDEMPIYLIYHLFEAKQTRLDGRKQLRKKEKEKYIDCAHRLHKAFDCIPKKEFYDTQKGKSLADNFNWAKVLYYNELAICYSGLTESSMSLGYAERSRLLLEVLLPELKNIKNKKISKKEKTITFSILLKLYTFALYNKGEADRLLHNNDLSLRIFKRIIEINEDKNLVEEPSSDYYTALLKMALILIDQGRGTEALKLLKKVKNPDKYDYRKKECDIEIASALIDQKKYRDARIKLLGLYNKDLTFTSRKASIYNIRCLLEWRKNKPTEFTENAEWTQYYNSIPKEINGVNANAIGGIIKECIDRKDGDNFKKACRYFSEFHEIEKKECEKKSSKQDKEKAMEFELWGYFLYLFYEEMDKIRNIQEWKDIRNEFKKNNDDFNEIIDKIEDTEYMKDFFDCYKDYLKNSKDDREEKFIIEKLYTRLIDLYSEKDELQEIEQIERDYEALDEKQEIDQNLKMAAKFIATRFFKTKPPDNKQDRIYLSSNTIENIMHRNTDEFADRILGSSKHILPSSGNKINGILTVLRRWNSFTPGLSSPANPSRGGGYFLYFKDENGKSKGIVIDPGFDFLNNLFFEGFTISDIDVVLISHAHPDHTDNFPKMLTLFHEMNGRLKKWNEKKEDDRKCIEVILTQGVFDLFSKQMDYSKKSLKDIYIVDTKSVGKTNEPIECFKDQFSDGKELKIKAFRTSHSDLSQWESIGFLLSIENNETPIKIGFTCDARWTNEFWSNFNDCSIICAHLGAIVNILDNKGFCNTFCGEFSQNNKENKCKKLDKCKQSNFSKVKVGIDKLKDQTRDENHLYLGGLTSLFNPLLKKCSNLKLGIISEFGEELKGGIRIDLFHKFDDWFQDRKCRSKSTNRRCLPGDIGLRVDIFSGDVFCQTCQRYVDRKWISPIAYGKEEAIFFVCKECKSVLSPYQIEEKLKNYYENGRKLELVEGSFVKEKSS